MSRLFPTPTGSLPADEDPKTKQVTIVCDGSSLANGSASARAGGVAILTYVDAVGRRHHKVVGEYLGNATNNQAEIVAACIGLEALKSPCRVTVISDSGYVIETMTGRYRQKKNHEFWRRLNEAASRHAVTWTWTRGHAGHPVQERCDKAAKEIAAAGRVDPKRLREVIDSLPKD